MTTDQLTEAHRCGRLYAALAELQKLSTGAHHSLGSPGPAQQIATEPRKHLTEHLEKAGRYLLDARNRGNGPAAAAVFRMLPDLLPEAKELPGDLRTDEKRERFGEGRDQQAAEIEKALKSL
ncbi:hypothetical protein OHA98_32980 [Streptomyces sp. NBC_00654]|uniref:hypothetical protein n=1 Tax=Streptomyces sp. NBC_00654 TaxID=2975799 RepID=UPI002257D27A|nr:hypothetical protein [Streptomyces sp. NBC_00654]MCX4969489.1 hypothetical protein [Streptomyces sp. NBC_00654]